MKKLELLKHLENFSDETEICVADHACGSLNPIEEVIGAKGESEQFLIRLSISGGYNIT